MALLRVYSRMDGNNKIALPPGIRKELNARPGEKLELKIVGIKKARKLLICKPKSGRRLP